ncbi:M48 family metalloprotease [Candidatus Pelagibacter sp. HIMB1495]|uniref:M48 family metallopeptidase n=1 Tax=unclassified Candidatus Pelagibacter TaxID=2647897 RepID=UPI003F8465EC
MNIGKLFDEYYENSYRLVIQSLFLFLLVPLIYLAFIEIVSTDEARFINDFTNPNYFNLDIKYVYYFQILSKILTALIVFNLSVLLIINWYVGIDHKRLTSIYIAYYRLTWLIIKITTLLVILIFLFIIVVSINNIFPEFKLRHWSFLILSATILGTLSAFFVVISIIYKFEKKTSLDVVGCKISKNDQPELFKLIKECSNKIKTKIPDNVILGTNEGFFVISSDVNLINRDSEELLTGRTLFISYLMLNILTKDELRGLIGHELAHFSGEDTEYSDKYKSLYFTLTEKFKFFRKGFEENEKNQKEMGITGTIFAFFEKFFLMMLFNPIMYITINMLIKNFKICMDQEFRADTIGSKICKDKKSMISGLCKFHIYSQINRNLFDNILKNKGKSLTSEFNKNYREYLVSYKFKDILTMIIAYEMYHPCDTHPPIIERMKNLKINFADIKESDLTKKNPSASSYIKDYDQLDELLFKFII